MSLTVCVLVHSSNISNKFRIIVMEKNGRNREIDIQANRQYVFRRASLNIDAEKLFIGLAENAIHRKGGIYIHWA